ncbi:flavin reductase (DIM6/NTAB) family NADH-FMN oxidoreductase RutF [Bradyrhizobium sp. GM24.11]
MDNHAAGPASRVGLRSSFLDGMSCAASTVNIVTTAGPAGRAGLTVSAMASVSAETEKPTLLICVHGRGAAAQTIINNGTFCVNILREDQVHIADCFAGRTGLDNGDRFSCAKWSLGATGAPRLIEALVSFDCRLSTTQLVGAHYVLFGSVENVMRSGDGNPLVYSRRAYGISARTCPVTAP